VLVIRDAQLAQLRHARLGTFVDDMVDYLAAEYPAHCDGLARDALRAFVDRSIEAAARFEVHTEGAIAVLTELRLVYGEHLERAPDREWARNILAHRRLPGHVKVEAVQNRLSEKTGGRVLVPFPPPA
jgi:hypothetical protein